MAVLAGVLLRRGGTSPPAVAAVPPERPGPVLLVPGFGGATGPLQSLAAALRADGRQAVVVPLPGDGTGDLSVSAQALNTAATAALAASGAPSVDVVGYSAGGVVARLWVAAHPGRARRVVTLGSPHQGTQVAVLGADLGSAVCPTACRQLVPGSQLLAGLPPVDTRLGGTAWLSVWTRQDDLVVPPDAARLPGALDLPLQDLCPGLQVGHGSLPTSPVVQAVVRVALSGPSLAPPTAALCTAP